MKKEYLILTLCIVALSGYLLFHKQDRTHYTLPDPPKVAADSVDRLVVQKPEDTIAFTRTEQGWVVTDQAYPADDAAMRQMLDVITGLKFSALVSENQDLVRYELDDGHCLDVTAYDQNKALLSFKIGKTAPTFNHTFVMLENDPNVYHATDSFRQHFDKTVNGFRDKQVMSFAEASITGMTIEVRGKQTHLSGQKSGSGSQDEAGTGFKYKDGSAPDPQTISNLLSTLSVLSCDRFVDDPDKQQLEKDTPDLTITLENGTPIVLHLFDQGEEGSVFGTSSMNGYGFVLEEYVAKDIRSWAHELAGLEQTEEEKHTTQ
ncbi:MAG TPA: DUF4340 domain-containing protein [Desulfotignum sp.]|nr:DUF4340 domain-containing protein [Desulfotignum sp.]